MPLIVTTTQEVIQMFKMFEISLQKLLPKNSSFTSNSYIELTLMKSLGEITQDITLKLQFYLRQTSTLNVAIMKNILL